jgi:sialidase-1
VWASFDGGKTWPVKRLVEEGGFAYSSMVAGREGTPSEGWIYLMYEGGGHPDSRAYITRFNLAWITGGRDWREFCLIKVKSNKLFILWKSYSIKLLIVLNLER